MTQDDKTRQTGPKPAVGSGLERLVRDYPEDSRQRINKTERRLIRQLPSAVESAVRNGRITW
jgi:hypothetical protein